MNVVSKAAVRDIPKHSKDYAVVQALCRGDSNVDNLTENIDAGSFERFFKVMLKVLKNTDCIKIVV